MALPSGFYFDQGRLQDYVECPRRFHLRHLLLQPWPEVVAGSVSEWELHAWRGAMFHHLVHQRTQGVEPERLSSLVRDPVLSRWWQTLAEKPPAGLPTAIRRSELTLSTRLGAHRLVARLDLLAIEPSQRAIIVDWKTSHRVPGRALLEARLQTRVYPLVVVEAAGFLNGGQALSAGEVEMCYWFAESGATERFRYDEAHYAAGRAYLEGLVAGISSRSEEVWPATQDAARCRFCTYRTLCETGAAPGTLDALDHDLEHPGLDLDVDSADELDM